MTKTVYIGMDVHSTNYTLSSYTRETDNCFSTVTLKPEVKSILKYIKRIKEDHGDDTATLPDMKQAALDTLFIKILRKKALNALSLPRHLFRSRKQVRSKLISVMRRR